MAIPSRHSVLYGMLATSLYTGFPLIVEREQRIIIHPFIHILACRSVLTKDDLPMFVHARAH